MTELKEKSEYREIERYTSENTDTHIYREREGGERKRERDSPCV